MYGREVQYSFGKPVNFAFKIEGLTRGKPNALLISEATYQYVQEFFNVTEVEGVHVEALLHVYQVQGKK